MQNQEQKPANVLWTGGWDSTYRVIQLVRQGRPVNPHYIIDNNRDSTDIEIKTIKRISSILNEKYGELISDAKIVNSRQLPSRPEIHKAHRKIIEESYLGSQYIILASYCKEFEVNDLNLCIHKDDKAYDHVSDFIEPAEDDGYRLSASSPDHISELFRYFVFPILNLTKLEMEDHTRTWNFQEIMEMTWFCHTPFMGKPCGTCYPCMYTINEGLSRRFSKIALIRYRMKLELRKYPTLVRYVQRVIKS
ncbi:Queuosine biosynthesis protein QueC [Marinobacter segnicrescens]|uniref:Queuosine biosynthesis protein QueC n=1 Tax=Marinobacter segnicrescens TaxID=430453 RepID=A0A1I0H1I2_9GAMM|nr:7-cyano-7-deazaguanine synthase [Marinobacter segnicrescens]SET77429.1 Queuosine biosynthesis protein QueC [Marinobacter segnicrescens]